MSRFFVLLFFQFFPAILAGTVNIERMMCYCKVQIIGSVVQYYLDTGVTKFSDFSTIGTNQVVVLLGFKSLFKLGNIFTKLMLDDQFTIQQKVDGIV